MHKTTICSCGKVLSTCRCPAPNKAIEVSNKPCTHAKPEIKSCVQTREHALHAWSSLWESFVCPGLEGYVGKHRV